MSDKEESTSAHLPVEGVIGITASVVLFLLAVMVFLYCRLYTRPKRNSAILQGNQGFNGRDSIKQTGIHKISYWKSVSDDNLRPTSGDSNHSFRFDASAMAARNQDGRIGYDRPYSRLPIPDMVEVSAENAQVQPQIASNSKEPAPAIVSNFGPVAMVSDGIYYDSHKSMGMTHLVSSEDSLNLNTQKESPIAVSHRQVLSPDRLSYPLYAEPHMVKPSADRQSHVLYAEPHNQHDSSANHIVIRGGGEPQCRTDRAPMNIPQPHSLGVDVGGNPARKGNSKPQTRNVQYISEQHDSFRDSQGLDLGADPTKAWMMYDHIG